MATAARVGGIVKWILYGHSGVRAGWKALLFVVIVVTLFLATRPLIDSIAPRSSTGPTSPQMDLVRELRIGLVVLAATWTMARLERRPLYAYGFTDSAGLRRLGAGACWGFLSISVLVAALWLHGSLAFDSFGGPGALPNATVSAVGALLVGWVEESLLRGYLQYLLSRALGFWWAALLLSLIFGLLHGDNGGETWLGLLGAGAGGLFFCLSLWYTKSLFWAVGFHSSFDWGESYFYGTPDSGEVAPWRLIATHPTGDTLWSGGSAGPEGAVLLIPLLVGLAVGMSLWWGRGRTEAQLHERWI